VKFGKTTITFTNNTDKVEVRPFSKFEKDEPFKRGLEIVIFFTSPFRLGFGFKIREVNDTGVKYTGIRFKWYNWTTLPWVYDSRTYEHSSFKWVDIFEDYVIESVE